jgi:hypothetical protein
VPTTIASEVARVVVMENVRLRDQTSGDGKVFSTISILKPVKEAGCKVGDQDARQEFKNAL